MSGPSLTFDHQLGQGAYGTVYKGKYDGKEVAIKAMTILSDDRNAQETQLFAQEAQCLASLDHPCIVKYYATLQVNGINNPNLRHEHPGRTLVIVEELLDGGNLLRTLARSVTPGFNDSYTDLEAMQWCLDIALALEYLHTLNPPVVHRDIKPSNALLTRRQGSARQVVKLSDFGLCRRLPVDAGTAAAASSNETSSSSSSSSTSNGLFKPADASEYPISRPDSSSSVYHSLTLHLPDMVSAAGLADCSTTQAAPVRSSTSGTATSTSTLLLHQPSSSALTASTATADPTCRSPSPAGSTPTAPMVLPLPLPMSADSIDAPDCSQEQLQQQQQQQQEDGNAPGSSTAAAAAGIAYSTSTSSGPPLWQLQADLTGGTGTALQMAPEVFLGLPYGCPADVFSFGALMYELLGRTMLSVQEFPRGVGCAADMDEYTERVAVQRYRPAKPRAMSEEAWALVSRCWRHEPLERPSMTEVVDTLEALLEAQQAKAEAQAANSVLGRISSMLSSLHSSRAPSGTTTPGASPRGTISGTPFGSGRPRRPSQSYEQSSLPGSSPVKPAGRRLSLDGLGAGTPVVGGRLSLDSAAAAASRAAQRVSTARWAAGTSGEQVVQEAPGLIKASLGSSDAPAAGDGGDDGASAASKGTAGAKCPVVLLSGATGGGGPMGDAGLDAAVAACEVRAVPRAGAGQQGKVADVASAGVGGGGAVVKAVRPRCGCSIM